MKNKLVVVAFVLMSLLMPVAAPAQDVWSYVSKKAEFVGGMAIIDDQKEKIVELRISDDFPLVETVRATVKVSLFTINRAGENAPPRIPTSIEEVKAYSDGEVWGSVYRPFNPNVAAECLTGVTFKMTSITGSVGNPLDGTKFAAACGVRLSLEQYHVTIVGGHYGPVAENDKVVGFIPAIIVKGRIPLSFIGKSTAFVPDLAFGRDQLGVYSRTLRLGIAAKF